VQIILLETVDKYKVKRHEERKSEVLVKLLLLQASVKTWIHLKEIYITR